MQLKQALLIVIIMTEFSLINTLQESINDKGKLKAVFVIGAPGAGKSYTLNQIQDGMISPRIINSDKMYEFLGKRGDFDISDASSWAQAEDTVHRTTQAQLSLYVNGLLPLFVDSTSAASGNLLRRKGILESFGYDVGLVWINVDVETAVKRAASRERAVPEDFIRRTFSTIDEDKSFLMGRFEWSTQINNNEGELTDAAIKSAYNATRAFYNAPVQNPLGKRNIAKLTSTNEKYLVPTVCSKEELTHLTTAWFRT